MNTNSRNDKVFQHRLTAIIEVNLGNEQFGVNELAAKMGLDRSQIHHTLKKVTNKSISQYIREIRIEKAKEFFKQGNIIISEITYKVGFGSPSYFIKCFHDYFGSPSGEIVKYAPVDSEKEENVISDKMLILFKGNNHKSYMHTNE